MADRVQFSPGDRANPRNWPEWRKWSIVGIIIPIDLTVSWAASGFSPAQMKFESDFGVSAEVGELGLSLYVLSLALAPMCLAPLSEYFGRSPIYITSYGVFLAFLLGTALVQNLGGFLVLRLLSGLFSAVTIANFGGTIADLWPHQATGIPMSLFLWAATCGSPSGYFLLSFVAQYRDWRYVFWALLGICGGFWLLLIAILRETRHTTILQSRAKKAMKGNHQLSRSAEDGVKDNPEVIYKELTSHRSARELFNVALLRPFRFLGTEAIIIFGALFNGFLYGLSFLFNTAFSLVFGTMGHGFKTYQVGLAFLGIVLGISIGPITNLWQERYYQRQVKGRHDLNIPEARVQTGQIAAIAHPISLFWFAWTSYKSVHWIVPILASTLWGWSFYTLILMTYMYTEDSYGVYSASALAGLGLIRNLAGAGFPLFGRQMYEKLGYEWASSLLAFLALLLMPIPFILSRYGVRLRQKSPWASRHISMDAHEPDQDQATTS